MAQRHRRGVSRRADPLVPVTAAYAIGVALNAIRPPAAAMRPRWPSPAPRVRDRTSPRSPDDVRARLFDLVLATVLVRVLGAFGFVPLTPSVPPANVPVRCSVISLRQPPLFAVWFGALIGAAAL